MRSLFVVLTCLVIAALLIQVTLVGCAKEEAIPMEPPGGEMMPDGGEPVPPEPPTGEMEGEVEEPADEGEAAEAADEGEAAGAEGAPVEVEGGE